MTFVKGDIIWVVRRNRNPRQLRHPAVVWDEYFDGVSDFNGIMLTHTPPRNGFDNINMEAKHFEAGFDFVYDNTHFVNQLFTKFHNWGPFYLTGRLTNDGILFLEDNLLNINPIEFEVYRRR